MAVNKMGTLSNTILTTSSKIKHNEVEVKKNNCISHVTRDLQDLLEDLFPSFRYVFFRVYLLVYSYKILVYQQRLKSF